VGHETGVVIFKFRNFVLSQGLLMTGLKRAFDREILCVEGERGQERSHGACAFMLNLGTCSRYQHERTTQRQHSTWNIFLNNLDRSTHATPSVALVQPLELGHIAVSMVFWLHGVHLVWLWILAHRARVVLF
jgi:hypothetical protein